MLKEENGGCARSLTSNAIQSFNTNSLGLTFGLILRKICLNSHKFWFNLSKLYKGIRKVQESSYSSNIFVKHSNDLEALKSYI